MSRIRAALLLLALALLARPAAAAVTVDEATGLRVVNNYDWLQAVDPKDGKVAWSRRVHGVDDASIVPVTPASWVLVRKGSMEAFDPTSGKVLWNKALGAPLAWGPKPVEGEGRGTAVVLALRRDGEERDVTFLSLDPATGQENWTHPVALDLESAKAWGGDLLLHLRSFKPRAPEAGYRRAAPTEAPPEKPAEPEDRLVLLDGATGQERWSERPRGQVLQGPWLLENLVLVEEQGDGEDERFLTAREKSDASIAWANALPRALPFPPAPLEEGDPEKRIVYFDGVEKGARLFVVEEERGQVFWEYELPGDLALGADSLVVGKAQVLLLMKAPDQDPAATLLVDLDRLTGQPTGDATVAGSPAQALLEDERLYVFLKESAKEPELDETGRPVMDLVEGKPKDKPVEGYTLVEFAGGEARRLAGDPRAALQGVLRDDEGNELNAGVVDGLILYATKSTPPQKEGEARKVDYRHPEEPVILHAFDPATGKDRWAWDPQKGRLDTPATLLEGTLFVPTEDESLLALTPSTGETIWETARTFGDGVANRQDGVTDVKGVGLFVISAKDVAFTLDPATGKVLARRNLVPIFNFVKLNNLLGVVLLTGSIAFFIYAARRRDLFIRRIAGLNALDEAVGRSTEMGKPVLYLTGLADVDDIQTLASLSILGHVARKTAEYDTPILVPNCRSVVMSMAQEVVKESYTAVGRPDAFNRDNVRYLTDEQFGFCAGVNGIQMRDRPAANFYMGTFYAESLILAETGNATGAIQIAGTASAAQLPFFVAACDYTLIGEELYAASAYLSRDPLQVGSLKGQDAGKAVIMASILIGTVAFSLGFHWVKELFLTS